MVIIETTLVRRLQARAVTVWPLLFVDPDTILDGVLLRHEGEHAKQQRRWAIYGLGIGLLVWHFLYLLVLPVGWNPFRERWERQAYQAGERYSDQMIDGILLKAPYYLWWRKSHLPKAL